MFGDSGKVLRFKYGSKCEFFLYLKKRLDVKAYNTAGWCRNGSIKCKQRFG